MQFQIHPSIFQTLPDYKVGVLVATNIKQKQSAGLKKLSDQAKKVAAELQTNEPAFSEWVTAFQKFHIAEEIKPSHLALLERAKQGELPVVFPLVDYLNAISLIEQIPIGAHDYSALLHPIEVRLTEKSDRFIPRNKNNNAEQVDENVPAYTSGSQVLTKNFIWRQGQLSAISEETKEVFIPIDTLGYLSDEELLKKMKRVQKDLETLFGAEVQSFLVSASSPECAWDFNEETTPEDQKLNEVLTRGVAEILPSHFSLRKLMKERKIKVYLGIDPTGSLLTLGHSVVLRKLQQFADLGHEVILLIGNGTVRIGDPTGRDSTRPVLTDEVIEQNFQNWKAQASKVLNFDMIKIVHNGDWLDKLTYAEIVKLMAQTTVQQLIERDMFQERLKKSLPIFGHEIMYPLLQGYDSVAMEVDLEIGGTDQTFNMMMGRHLLKVMKNKEKWVLTTPIISGNDGRKMSKSYGNFIALTEEPRQMYGKLMSIPDHIILDYFTLLTDEPLHSIEAMKKTMAEGQNPMLYKKKLAFTLTQMYHSKAEALEAAVHFEKTVQQKEIPSEIPVVHIRDTKLSLLDLLTRCEPKTSKSQLRRLIEQQAVELTMKNLEKIKPTNAFAELSLVNVDVIRVGKRKYYKIMT